MNKKLIFILIVLLSLNILVSIFILNEARESRNIITEEFENINQTLGRWEAVD